jgi:hypothetical protein
VVLLFPQYQAAATGLDGPSEPASTLDPASGPAGVAMVSALESPVVLVPGSQAATAERMIDKRQAQVGFIGILDSTENVLPGGAVRR